MVSKKRQSISLLFFSLLIVIAFNVIANYLFFRIDLTAEKRYSISPTTIQQLKKLDDVVYVKVYLEGDLNPGFKRLRNGIREIMDEFRAYAKDNIEYEFIDPSASSNEKERNELYRQLAKKGLMPTNVQENNKGSASEKILFPGAMITYKGKEYPLNLLKSKLGSSTEEMLNASVEGLEYEFMNSFRKFSTSAKPKVGFLQGQHELDTKHLTDAARSLSEFYDVDTVQINQQLNALNDYKAIIIAKPDSAFNEKDKFILDQYIMKGGRVLWLVEEIQMDMDSLSNADRTAVAIAQPLNLQDQLFKYGVRVNDDLIMDMLAAPIPVVTGRVGNQPSQRLFPWYFFPLLNGNSHHPIVNNLNAVKGEFTSSIDTVEAPGIKKTILLTTSKNSKSVSSPARVSLNILETEPDPTFFSQRYLPVAVLLEGSFPSLYTHRVPAEIVNNPSIGFKESSVANKMIVISDGDIISNYVRKNGQMYPLGFDRHIFQYTGRQQIYGNKNFILNCVDYLCDQENIVDLRGKEFQLRLLDPTKAEQVVYSWTALIAPIALVLIYGLIHNYLRRRKYAA
jgi:ABC-2 type transport system permease protein